MEFSTTIEKGVNSLYAEQLRRGFRSLRFVDFLEEEFRQVYLEDNFQKSRLVIAFSLIVVVLTAMISMATDTGDTATSAFGLWVMAPMLTATLVVSYTAQRFVYQVLLALSALVIGVAGAAVDVEASLAGMGYYFAGQIGWIYMIWLLLGLLFPVAAGLSVAISVAYLVVAIGAALPMEEILFSSFMLLNVNLLGGYSCYKIEYGARRTFLESKLLNQLAQRDGLTGLYNRRSFDQYIDRIWRQSRREKHQITVMLFDIDHFKAFNDTYGHQAGDDALKEVASIIASGVQRPLDFAARYGGEEFALILYGPASDYGRELPERLRQMVAERKIRHEGSATGQLSMSIGVAIVHPGASRSLAGAIQMADEALYEAKASGRDKVIIRESEHSTLETGRFKVKQAS